MFLLIVTEFFVPLHPFYTKIFFEGKLTALGYHLLQYILWKEMNLCCL